MPKEVTEIVSGGAKGIDIGIKLTEFLPEYEKYRRGAPLKRNLQIIDYADLVLAFWEYYYALLSYYDRQRPPKYYIVYMLFYVTVIKGIK